MKAAVWHGPDRIRVEQVPVPVSRPGDLLVQVRGCNICGSDLRTYVAGSSSIVPPVILGHEFAGDVIQAPGQGIGGFQPGDRVVAMQDTPCGECEYCLGGNEHVCENKLEFGKHFPGGFAEYVLVPQVVVEKGWVRRVPEGLSYDAATLVEPLSSCVHAQHISGIGRGDNIVVIGAGPIGCMHLQLARHRGARSVTMVEISGARLSLVQAFSPDLVIDPSKGDMVESFRAVYPVGADVAIVACPSPEAVSQAVLVTRKCGRVVIFGGLPKDRAGVCLDGNYIHYEEISVMGSYAYTRAENDEALELVRTGVVRPENYITQVFCLDDVVQAFEAAKAATALKIKVVPC